jgi:hypothetical protein
MRYGMPPEGVVFQPRQLNPLDPRTPLHMRRVCGVCTSFAGTLKDTGKRPCAAFCVDVTATQSAAECPRWSRK